MFCSCALTAMLMATPVQAQDCTAIGDQARIAATALDEAALTATYAAADRCDPALKTWIGQRLAAAMYNRAMKGSPVDEAALEQSLRYGRPWQTLATLGDIAAGRRDFAKAAARYQDALIEIADEVATPRRPGDAILVALRSKAEEAALLSPTYVKSARTRSGQQVGLSADSLRGVTFRPAALPVQFVFDSTELTTKGQDALVDLVSLLANDSAKGREIILVGHTDAKGDADYNLRLSQSRAMVVKEYLLRNGYRGTIRAEGRGEEQPYEPDDKSAYSEAERDQMSRRVELIRR